MLLVCLRKKKLHQAVWKLEASLGFGSFALFSIIPRYKVHTLMACLLDLFIKFFMLRFGPKCCIFSMECSGCFELSFKILRGVISHKNEVLMARSVSCILRSVLIN